MISDEYRAGWRAACAHLHDLLNEAADFYGDAPGRAAITGTYKRAANVALGEAEDPQPGLVVAGGGPWEPATEQPEPARNPRYGALGTPEPDFDDSCDSRPHVERVQLTKNMVGS